VKDRTVDEMSARRRPDDVRAALPGIHANLVSLMGQRIVSGALQPGEVLPDQTELSRQFGVSRTVIREATKVLSAKGMVDSRPKRGTMILPREHWHLLDPDVLAWQETYLPGVDFATDIMDVREVMEPGAAKLAATRTTAADLAALEAALTAIGAAADEAAYIQADVDFHSALVATTHNVYLVALLASFTAALRVSFAASVRAVRAAGATPGESWTDFVRSSAALHERVLDAVRRRDPEAAMLAMQQIIGETRTHRVS
jgi:GntR family transcriptional regulator, galactonate operon transcriptional repressor